MNGMFQFFDKISVKSSPDEVRKKMADYLVGMDSGVFGRENQHQYKEKNIPWDLLLKVDSHIIAPLSPILTARFP
jgi:hypothetical protein